MQEYNLEEELLEEFKGGTLSIHSDIKLINENVPTKSESLDKIDNETSNTNKQWSSNLISPLTSIPNKICDTVWTKKRHQNVEKDKDNTLQQAVCISEDPNNYFTFREGVIGRALTECCDQFLNEETDGPLIDAFLLTQISHWNSDKERLLLLTPKTLVVAKYDFIALKRLAYKKLPLELVDELIIGELIYPTGSLIPKRNMKGIRLVWNNGKEANFGSQWNPFNEDVPFFTFTFHPLYFHKESMDEKLRNLYNLELFVEKCGMLLADLPKNKISTNPCKIEEKEIMLPNYIGLGSVIHNRNSLGFFKVRGKFSF